MSTLSGKSEKQPLLTKNKIWAVFFVQLNEAYQITVLLPMVVFMVRDFGIQPELLGIYTSILNASFCFCQFLCCYAWGLASDKWGRRIALLIGLVFSTIAITLFGLSKNFGTAIAARCISGFFNGNLGVIKAYLADVTDASNRAWAFSTLAISYGFGSVLGSMCGGIFIETHDVDVSDDQYIKTVGILKWWIFDTQYPFLLPCLMGAIISGNAVIWTLLFIQDEKLVFEFSSTDKDTDYQSVISDRMMIDTLDNISVEGHNYPKSMNELGKLAVMEAIPGDGIHSMTAHSLRSNITTPRYTERQGLLMSPLKNDGDNTSSAPQPIMENDYSTVFSLVFETQLIHGLVVWTLLIMAFMMYQEMGPVYMAQALGFNSQLIGYSMAFSGGALLLFTYYIQPFFLKHFRFRPMGIICAVAMIIVILHMPSIYTTVTETGIQSNDDSSHMISLIFAFINSIGGVCFGSVLFVCTMCWVNNSVPNSCVGRANGMAQTMAALVRAVGPALTGFIWSASVTHIETNRLAVYYAYLPSFVCFVIIGLWIYLYIGNDCQLMWEQREHKQKNRWSRITEHEEEQTTK